MTSNPTRTDVGKRSVTDLGTDIAERVARTYRENERTDEEPMADLASTVTHPARDDERPECPHGMPAGNQPDPFVGGRQACPQCARDTARRPTYSPRSTP